MYEQRVWRLILSGMSFFVDIFVNQNVTDSGAFAALCYFEMQQKSYDRMQKQVSNTFTYGHNF